VTDFTRTSDEPFGAPATYVRRAPLDRHRQHEALVVIRMLADQVDATGGGKNLGGSSVQGLKFCFQALDIDHV
jgi:hypothetical protein